MNREMNRGQKERPASLRQGARPRAFRSLLRPGSFSFWIGGAAILLFCAAAAQSAGYLAVIGPAPLRFQDKPAPRDPAEIATMLAPKTNAPPASATITTESKTPPEAASREIPPMSPGTPSVFVASSPEPQPASSPWMPFGWEPPSGDPPVVNQNAVLEYLAPVQTNGFLRVPVGMPMFVPATPPPAQSRAVYESR